MSIVFTLLFELIFEFKLLQHLTHPETITLIRINEFKMLHNSPLLWHEAPQNISFGCSQEDMFALVSSKVIEWKHHRMKVLK